jgi:hypothetical protein
MPSDRRAAIICSHVAGGELPLLSATRDAPSDATDSGWQFHCNVHDHLQIEDGRVWAVEEVLVHEPSLGDWIDGPPGTRIERESAEHPWRPVTGRET